MKHTVLIASALLFFIACTGPKPAPQPAYDDEAAVAACARLEQLRCRSRDGRNLWEPTPGNVTCVEVFRNAADAGVNLSPECVAKIEKCEDRSACSQ